MFGAVIASFIVMYLIYLFFHADGSLADASSYLRSQYPKVEQSPKLSTMDRLEPKKCCMACKIAILAQSSPKADQRFLQNQASIEIE